MSLEPAKNNSIGALSWLFPRFDTDWMKPASCGICWNVVDALKRGFFDGLT